MLFQLCAARSPRAGSGRLAPSHRVSRLLACLALLVPATGFAADGTLAPVVVTGTREPEALARSTSDIVLIDADTLRRTTADSIEDLIRRQAGMQLARNGGPGQSTGFFIRGASTNSTVVLVDGVRVGSATLGQAEFEALSLAQVERIEVLRGPASSLYGADAVGGVVQIFTRRGEGPVRFSAAADVGGYGSRRGDVGASGSAAGFDYAASLGRESSHGVSAIVPNDIYQSFNPDRDGYARNSGSVRVGYTPAAGHRLGASFLETHLDAHYDGADFLPPDFLPDASADFRNRLKTRVASLDYRGALTSAWTTTLQASRSVDDLSSGGQSTSRFITRRDQATWQNAVALASDQQLVVALERLLERVGGDTYPGGLGRSNNAAVVGYSGRFAAHSIQLDVRRDDN
jgi:vitamin B12 transporter